MPMTNPSFCILAGLIGMIGTPAAPGEPPSLERFLKIRAPGSVTLGPAGQLFTVDWPDGVNQLYRRAPGSEPGTPMDKLSSFQDGISSYTLSPDGARLILAAAVGGNEQNNLYTMDPATGAMSDLLINPKVVYSHDLWLRDGSGFIYTANDASPADFHIYRHDFKTGENVKLLARPGNWYAADITDDGSRLLVGQFRSASDSDIFELDTTTGELKDLGLKADPTAANGAVAYLPDFQSVLFTSDVDGGINRLYLRPLAGGAPTRPIPSMDAFDVDSSARNEDHSLLAVVYNEGGFGTMRVVELPSFEPVEIPGIEKGLVSSVKIRGRTLTWTLSNTRTPNLSFAYTIGQDRAPRALTEADEQGIDLSSFPLPDLITYKSFDGLEVPAFLYLPPGYRKGTPIPFVVNFHGGPEGQFRPGFSRNNQFLLSRSFGVLEPNVRGSTGYGRAYHMMDDYTKRWDSVKDGVAAARWLVDSGYSANGRIAAWGGSYGGFMSVATVIEGGAGGATNPFGAAIDVVGIVNFKTFLEQTKDYRRKLREAEYGPLTDLDFLAGVSPINRIDEINVPMLIAHGLNDPRVPVGEAMQLAVGLQKRGMDPELVYFPDEGHGFAKLENRLIFTERAVRFLEKHLNP
jgi:dipeptidyl aminopeptidase/acylaminoacyl peptidase